MKKSASSKGDIEKLLRKKIQAGINSYIAKHPDLPLQKGSGSLSKRILGELVSQDSLHMLSALLRKV